MNERTPCPLCRHDNPPENRFCGRCGTSLASSEQLALRQENRPVTVDHALPVRLSPAGKALALGLAALAAEAGLAWLRRRNERSRHPLTLVNRGIESMVPKHFVSQSLEEVFVRLQEGNFRDRTFAWRVVRSTCIEKPTK
jgi:hypothetical protein